MEFHRDITSHAKPKVVLLGEQSILIRETQDIWAKKPRNMIENTDKFSFSCSENDKQWVLISILPATAEVWLNQWMNMIDEHFFVDLWHHSNDHIPQPSIFHKPVGNSKSYRNKATDEQRRGVLSTLPHLWQPVRPESERRTAIRRIVPKKASVEAETSTLI